MTLKEAAKELAVTPGALRLAIHRGTLAATKRGRDWHVTPAAVARYRRDHARNVYRSDDR